MTRWCGLVGEWTPSSPPSPSPLSAAGRHPPGHAGEDKWHLCVRAADRRCLSVRGEMAAEPWGQGLGPSSRAAPRSGAAAGAEECVGAASAGAGWGGGSRDLLPDPTRPPFPAGRPWLAPFFPAVPVGSCIPAWRPTRAAPASGIACSPSPQTLPAAACGCSLSPPLSGKAALNPTGLAGSCCQHPLAPCLLQPLPSPRPRLHPCHPKKLRGAGRAPHGLAGATWGSLRQG